MALDSYTLNGRDVPKSDVVLELALTPFGLQHADLFLERNLSRIDEAGDVKKKVRSAFRRTAGARTPPLVQPTVVLTFSDPPAQSRPFFTIGYDPNSCDVVCTDPAVSDVHIKLALEGDDVVLYDVSSSGSRITLDRRGVHRTYPKPGAPYRCILPPDCAITLSIPGQEFIIRIPSRNLEEIEDYCQNRDAFLWSRSGGKAPPVGLPELSQYRGSDWRPMYWLESRLGNGAFGAVSRVRRLHDWAVFAVKELKGDDDGGQDSRIDRYAAAGRSSRRRRFSPPGDGSLAHEMRVLQHLQGLRHERVIQYMDWYEDGPGRDMLVMEYCPEGSLADMISASPGPFSHSAATLVLQQLAEGLAYLHENRVTHRDLKPANVLVRQMNPLSLALADFGLASLMKKGDSSSIRGGYGTMFYSAPELLDNQPYTNTVDIWSMGVIGVEMLDPSLLQLTANVAMDYPKGISARAKVMYQRSSWPVLQIVNNMLTWRDSSRPSAAECVDNLDQLLKLERPSLAELALLTRSKGHGPSPEQVRYFAMGAGATVRPTTTAQRMPTRTDGYGRSHRFPLGATV
jgi:hypothetical protein